MSRLEVELERPLPATLPVGRATAVFCVGSCFHDGEVVEGLELVVDGRRLRTGAWGMPRPELPVYRSGFWATLPIGARDRPGTVEVSAAARLSDGRELEAPLARIEVVEPSPRPPQDGVGEIAICMGTFDPDMDLFRTQIDSLRSQTEEGWVCLISDDCSSPDRFEAIEAALEGDPRFVLSRSERRLGFYRNFERALEMLPADAQLVALCDQDDRWYPDKLEVLRGALGDAQLVYSDQRLVDTDGNVLRESLWVGRRNNHTNLASLLIANTITGAAALFRREVAEQALPFPDMPGWQFHDHWLGLVALASGEVAYVDRPLYDYVQHAGAVFGDVATGARRERPGWRERLRGGRAAYFYGFMGREVQAQALLARCSGAISPRKRRALRRFISAERSAVGLAWLATRPLRVLLGLNETLGIEGQLARGVLWRLLLPLRARRQRSRGALDAGLPPLASYSEHRLRRWRARL